ncbi:hypothetical protein A2954_02550 [Candidatus Roizmanbacteria bacterium RIFCSPLOWO2_01_FULL_37_12]|uniref:Uncharacterized protein n=1 Tax=Candidatus Roizmanbacteria bacterium RIFCSPLOWO2_01_FULL_37_12 TaxID=1802056 RepID=A0A1F7IEW5_9BACT|nr:MAG: hypothetical protein A3D76_00010 [Candidatus Roizmanbacteria bacterium RIFCSPHIGHO2_02_FULL_37_9b]OGK41906.1 MAG: hypothetical protein A2954_02550 [Candidatus Roizmanbacteria bacterium RIFCSPLOWO2_01_FULL_37_12]
MIFIVYNKLSQFFSMKLNKNQKIIIAEVFGQISVAWFVVGIISPVISKNLTLDQIIRSFSQGLIWFLVFLFIAIFITRR